MSFETLYVRKIGDTSDPYSLAGTDENGNIVPDINDGDNFVRATTTDYRITNEEKDLQYGDLKIDICITDSRVIFSCKNYDKGSTWFSTDIISGLAATAIDRGITHAMQKGKIYVGHLRYEWLRSVQFQHKTSFRTEDLLALTYVTNSKRHTIVLGLKNGPDPEILAKEIFNRACAYRLSMNDEKDDSLIDFYANPSKAEWVTLDNTDGKYVLMANWYFPPNGGIDFHPVHAPAPKEKKETDGPLSLVNYMGENNGAIWNEGGGLKGLEADIINNCKNMIATYPNIPIVPQLKTLIKSIEIKVPDMRKTTSSIADYILANKKTFDSNEDALLVLFFCSGNNVLHGKFFPGIRRKTYDDMYDALIALPYWENVYNECKYYDTWCRIIHWFVMDIEESI